MCQNRKESTAVDYLTIAEAAKRCSVSDKTIQRAIRAEKLPAHYPKPNRCEIAVSDLEQFLQGQVSGHMTEPMEQRLIELEYRVKQLESLVAELLSKQEEAPPSKQRAKVRERTTGPLPRQLISLLAFARHHNVAEAKAQTHTDMGLLPTKRGEWIDTDGTRVTLALDSSGRTAFYQLYHGIPPFVECKQCPH